MTPALLKSRRTKERLFKIFQETPSTENKIKYCSYKNKFTALKRKAEKEYYSNELELARNNLRETWRIIKNIMNSSENPVALPDTFKYKDKIIDDAQDISNKFNKYFVEIGPTLDAKIEAPSTDFKHFLNSNTCDSFFIRPASSEEIVDTINSCKDKRSSGIDNIPMTVIKKTGVNIAALLAHICNLSFENAVVPSDMKIANVTPLFKCEARDEFSNYRPISLLPNFSKILE